MRRWQERALCRGCDPNLWFPELGDDGANAKAICATCPVADECLAGAIERGERFGIWGGVATKERRVIRREIREAS